MLRTAPLRACAHADRKGYATLAGSIPNWQRYGIAIPATLIAALLVAAVSRWTAVDAAPLQILTLAVVVSSYVGGGGPGLLATALSTAIAAFFFLEPKNDFHVATAADQVR